LISGTVIKDRRFNAFLDYELNAVMRDVDADRRFTVFAGIEHY
jgi:hypothetical protein